MMRLSAIILFLVATMAAGAQTLNLSSPTVSYKPGDSFSMSVSLSGGGEAAIEFSVTVPSGWAFTPSLGASATAAAKQIDCAQQAGKLLCLIFGLNQNMLQEGTLATFTTVIPPSQGGGNLTIGLADTNASDPSGTGIAVVAGPPLSTSIVIPPVISKCDLNGDGATDSTDVQISRDQALGRAPAGNADLSGDGQVTSLDVQRVINAAAGQACRLGP